MLKQSLKYLAREGTALMMAVYAGIHAYGGPQNPENGMVAMFWVSVIMGIYIWCQDFGAAKDEDVNPGRVILETGASAIPLAVAGYALVQHLRNIELLAEYNMLVLVLVVIFTGKDVVVGLYNLLRILFLTDDFKGRIKQE